jgi:hypothetical protein
MGFKGLPDFYFYPEIKKPPIFSRGTYLALSNGG